MFIYPFSKNTFQLFLKLAAKMLAAKNPDDMISVQNVIQQMQSALDEAAEHFKPESSLPDSEKATAEQIELERCERNLLLMLQTMHDCILFTYTELNPAQTIIPAINLETHEENRIKLTTLYEEANANQNLFIAVIQYFIAYVAECLSILVFTNVDTKVVFSRITSGSNLINILNALGDRQLPVYKIANVPTDLLEQIQYGMRIATESRNNPVKPAEYIIFNITRNFVYSLIDARNETERFCEKMLKKEMTDTTLRGLLAQGFRDFIARIDSTLIRLNLSNHQKYDNLLKPHYAFHKLKAKPPIDEDINLKKRFSCVLPHMQSDPRMDMDIAIDILIRHFSVAEALIQAYAITDTDRPNREAIRVAARLLLENIQFDTKVLGPLAERLQRKEKASPKCKENQEMVKWIYHTASACQLLVTNQGDDQVILSSLSTLTVAEFNFEFLKNACFASGISFTFQTNFMLQLRMMQHDNEICAFTSAVENINTLINRLRDIQDHQFLLRIYGAQLIFDLYLSTLYHCRTLNDFAKLQTDALKHQISILLTQDISFLNRNSCEFMMSLFETVRSSPTLCSRDIESVSLSELPLEFLVKSFHLFKGEILGYENEGALVGESENNYRLNAFFDGLFYQFAAAICGYLSQHHHTPEIRAEAEIILKLIQANKNYYECAAMLLVEQLTYHNTEYYPADFARPVNPEMIAKRREATFLDNTTVTKQRGNAKTTKGQKQKKNKPVKYVPIITHEFDIVRQHFGSDFKQLSTFYQRGLTSRNLETQRAALLGCAKTLNLFAEIDDGKPLAAKIKDNADAILNQSKNAMIEADYRVFYAKYHSEMTTWNIKSTPVTKEPAPEATNPQEKPVTIVTPVNTEKKKKSYNQHRDTARMFNPPREATTIRESSLDRNIVLIRGGKAIPAVPASVTTTASTEPRRITILKRIDRYAAIRKKIFLPIIPIPVQMQLLNLLNKHDMDPVIHGGRVFYALLGMNDATNGDLDVMCHVTSRKALRELLESNKESLHIADFQETTHSKADILIVKFNAEKIKDQIRSRADYKLEIACIPDLDKTQRCTAIINQCTKYGLMCPLYDPFTSTILDTSNQVENFMMDPEHSLPFQPAAGDPAAYLKANPERILDIFKRKAVCLSRNVRLDIKPLKPFIMSANTALACKESKFSMERFNRLFHLKYARFSYTILLEHHCIAPLFPNLRKKHYADLERACITHDQVLAPFNLDQLDLPQLQEFKAAFIANIFYNSFLSEYNVTNQHQFYVDSADFLSQFSFETRYDAELIQLVQDKWIQILMPENRNRMIM